MLIVLRKYGIPVPEVVEMMGFLGAGNNPNAGMTARLAVAAMESLEK